jgi:hypothetical protein
MSGQFVWIRTHFPKFLVSRIVSVLGMILHLNTISRQRKHDVTFHMPLTLPVRKLNIKTAVEPFIVSDPIVSLL